MNRFTSTARRDGRWWVVQCDQYPAALSQVVRLDQAAAHQREAIAFVADLDESDVDVEVVPVLSSETEELLARARADRTNAEKLARAASETTRTLARRLVDEAYSLRDIGVVLGVSHQRVAQILGS